MFPSVPKQNLHLPLGSLGGSYGSSSEKTFFHLRVFLNKVLPFSKYLEMSLGFLIYESPFHLKISPSCESDQETMESTTQGQLFSHGLSPPNEILFNSLINILNFSKDHNRNFFARPSKDLFSLLKAFLGSLTFALTIKMAN